MATGIVADCEKIGLVNEYCERVSLWGLIVPIGLAALCIGGAWDAGLSPKRYVDRRADGWMKGQWAELLPVLLAPMSAALAAGTFYYVSGIIDGSAICHRIALW
jgi:hypothetical protein